MIPEKIVITIDCSRLDLVPAEQLMKGMMLILKSEGIESQAKLSLSEGA